MKDVSIKNAVSNLFMSSSYQEMIQLIEKTYPAIKRDTENFYKTQSQFMDNMLTVSAPTELRNLRQILAEINKVKMALQESYFEIKKKEIKIRQKRELLTTVENLDADLLLVEIEELECQIENTQDYQKGAIRKITAYITQYNNILVSIGKEDVSEADFEADEERYHIMKMFEQALCAARSHGGVIDEGNQIYAHQIGINGTVAQKEISEYLSVEQALMNQNQMPAHEMTIKWLKVMAQKYAGCAQKYANIKGMTVIDDKALNK